jgi:hypothetical protein
VLIGAGGGSIRLLLRAAWALLDPRRTAAKTKIENADFISHYRWFGGLLLWLRIIYAIGHPAMLAPALWLWVWRIVRQPRPECSSGIDFMSAHEV